MSQLFSPLTLRNVTLRNRTVVSPMCQYSAQYGMANDWHFAHLARFAIGGFGLVIVEATSVTPEGRISYGDLGLWEDAQIAPLKRIADFLRSQGTASAIQLGHAGRKASTPVPWRLSEPHDEAGRQAIGYQHWQPEAPSAEAHAEGWQVPIELDHEGLARIKDAFVAATKRADAAGFDIVEVHGAHGYLLNEFLSPLANHRTDEYGGSLENRMRFPLEVVEAVRAAWPAGKPLFMRISTSDNHPDGWQVEDSTILAAELKTRGIDVVDCSSGGFAGGRIISGANYQVPFARAVRETGIKTMAVGLIVDPGAAEAIIVSGDADLVALARTALEDPNWPVHARHRLHGDDDPYDLWPAQASARIRDRDRALGLRRE